MDTLRASNLANVLQVETDANENMDKSLVNKLVISFGELSKHEKMLFLISIREFTRETNVYTNGTTTPVPVKEEEPSSVTTATPQAQRLLKTSNWLQKTFIQDNETALPKAEMYLLYRQEFQRQNEKPISTADFGKLIRSVFPNIKARRLGQRGQSKYCYANIRKRSEIEKPALPNPLPSNELITWAKNKFNIDFTEVSQVVSYLKSESTITPGRKRRASCGGPLKTKPSKAAQRSASVSILELESKDDPLMVLHDTESLEIGSYFENGSGATQWPQLRSLLTDDSNSGFSSLLSTGSKKKRHLSSFEFVKPSEALLNRSHSVPVSGHADDDLQPSTTSYFDNLLTRSTGNNNPLLTSSLLPAKGTSTSSCSSNSSVMFDSVDVVVGGGVAGDNIGVEIPENALAHNHSDVFFDSVFDMMMNDCQN